MARTAAGLVVASSIVGWMLLDEGVHLFPGLPPLLAGWLPLVGPGTPFTIVVVTRGPGLATRLAWPRLLATSWVAAAAWTIALALVDGWQRGVVDRLSSGEEYRHDVARVGALVRNVSPTATWRPV